MSRQKVRSKFPTEILNFSPPVRRHRGGAAGAATTRTPSRIRSRSRGSGSRTTSGTASPLRASNRNQQRFPSTKPGAPTCKRSSNARADGTRDRSARSMSKTPLSAHRIKAAMRTSNRKSGPNSMQRWRHGKQREGRRDDRPVVDGARRRHRRLDPRYRSVAAEDD
jgi:hypothetical protein